MEVVRLGDIVDINIGKTPSRNVEKYWGKGEKWLSIKDMKEKFIRESSEEITQKAIEDTNIKIVPKDTVIMSFKLSIGKRAITSVDIYTNEAIAAFYIRDNKRIYNHYLYYVLEVLKFEDSTDRAVMGLTLNKKKLKELKIPLPQLETQKKIVKVLDKAQELIDKRKEQISKLDLLIQSIFYNMFGDPVTNPKGWEVKKIIEESQCIVPSRDKPKSFTGNIPWITTNDLIENGFTTESKTNRGLTTEEIKEVKSKIIPSGSVIISCVGDLGITTINDREVVINQQLHSFQCGENLNTLYIKYLLPLRKDYMYKVANSTTVPYMNKSKCNNIPIIIPPLELQNKFSEIVEKIEDQRKNMEISLKNLELNYKSIMNKVFKGGV